jgi:small ubiquitin-related modifier
MRLGMADAVQDVKPDADHINLRVIAQDNSEVHFKIRKTTQMRKLKQAYCDRQGLQLSSVRFLFDGTRLEDDVTPKQLEMEDDDVIEVMQEQTGGHS